MILILDVQLTNLNLCDVVASLWPEISQECFKLLDGTDPESITAFLKAKGGPTYYLRGVPIKVSSECVMLLLLRTSYIYQVAIQPLRG